MDEIDWRTVVLDKAGTTVMRHIIDGDVKGEIRDWPDGGVHWWIDLESSGHWGLAEDHASAIGMIDLIREVMP